MKLSGSKTYHDQHSLPLVSKTLSANCAHAGLGIQIKRHYFEELPQLRLEVWN
jgi:hypothetical protein